jgi:hypothetical protein
MKMTQQHYTHLLESLRPLSDSYPAMLVNAQQDSRTKDPLKRARWDLLYKAGLSKWICDNLYSYLNDEHIDTALRRIVAAIT